MDLVWEPFSSTPSAIRHPLSPSRRIKAGNPAGRWYWEGLRRKETIRQREPDEQRNIKDRINWYRSQVWKEIPLVLYLLQLSGNLISRDFQIQRIPYRAFLTKEEYARYENGDTNKALKARLDEFFIDQRLWRILLSIKSIRLRNFMIPLFR